MKVILNVNDKFLINRETECEPYVVCTNYNGSSWIWGHYFSDLANAIGYFAEALGHEPKSKREREVGISYDRMSEIATRAIDLFCEECEDCDPEYIRERFGDFDFDFDEKEIDYFHLEYLYSMEDEYDE